MNCKKEDKKTLNCNVNLHTTLPLFNLFWTNQRSFEKKSQQKPNKSSTLKKEQLWRARTPIQHTSNKKRVPLLVHKEIITSSHQEAHPKSSTFHFRAVLPFLKGLGKGSFQLFVFASHTTGSYRIGPRLRQTLQKKLRRRKRSTAIIAVGLFREPLLRGYVARL